MDIPKIRYPFNNSYPVTLNFGSIPEDEEIKKKFEKHQIDLSDRIKKYQELLEDIKNRGDEAKKIGLDLKEYGLYLITK